VAGPAEEVEWRHVYQLSCAGLTRASIAFAKMDCRVKPGNDKINQQ
jgi:hypothetical protein